VDVYTFHSTAVARNPNVERQLNLMREANPKFLIVPSQWQGESLKQLAKAWGFRLPEIIPIWHGVHFWKLPPSMVTPNSFILWGKAHLGRVGDNHILAEVAKRFPRLNFKVTIWQKGIPKPRNVEIIGRQSFNWMLNLMSRCLLMIFTWPESGGIQAYEAMALGKPVLSPAAGGVAEVIKHKRNGYLWRNLEELCSGIDYCLSHYADIGEAAKVRAKELTWERSARKHLEVYLRCLV